MARPRTPTAVLELRGGFKNRPSRLEARQNEPKVSTALPGPPKYLVSSTAAAAWLEMKSWGYWLTSADRFLVEIAATFVARYRADQLKSADVSLLIGVLGKIGFSPSERRKLNLPDQTTRNAKPLPVSQQGCAEKTMGGETWGDRWPFEGLRLD